MTAVIIAVRFYTVIPGGNDILCNCVIDVSFILSGGGQNVRTVSGVFITINIIAKGCVIGSGLAKLILLAGNKILQRNVELLKFTGANKLKVYFIRYAVVVIVGAVMDNKILDNFIV